MLTFNPGRSACMHTLDFWFNSPQGPTTNFIAGGAMLPDSAEFYCVIVQYGCATFNVSLKGGKIAKVTEVVGA